MTAILDSEGRINIPAEERLRLGLEPGQTVEVEIRPAKGKVPPAPGGQSPFHRLIGSRKGVLGDLSTMEYLEQVRGPVELPPRAEPTP